MFNIMTLMKIAPKLYLTTNERNNQTNNAVEVAENHDNVYGQGWPCDKISDAHRSASMHIRALSAFTAPAWPSPIWRDRTFGNVFRQKNEISLAEHT